MKNWDFADAEPAIFDPEKTAPIFYSGPVFSGSKIACSAKVKTNSSACLGISEERVIEVDLREELYFFLDQETSFQLAFGKIRDFQKIEVSDV